MADQYVNLGEPLSQEGVPGRSCRVGKSLALLSLLIGLGCATLWALGKAEQQGATMDPAMSMAVGMQPIQQRAMVPARAWPSVQQVPTWSFPKPVQRPVLVRAEEGEEEAPAKRVPFGVKDKAYKSSLREKDAKEMKALLDELETEASKLEISKSMRSEYMGEEWTRDKEKKKRRQINQLVTIYNEMQTAEGVDKYPTLPLAPHQKELTRRKLKKYRLKDPEFTKNTKLRIVHDKMEAQQQSWDPYAGPILELPR